MAAFDDRKLERIQRLRDKVIEKPEVCIEKAYWYTKSYKDTDGETPAIRRAKAMANVLQNTKAFIDDGELIVGRLTGKTRGGILNPESNAQWILEELDTIHTREWDQYKPILEEEKQVIREVASYWKGKSVYDHWICQLPEDSRERYHIIHEAGSFSANGFMPGHSFANFEKVLKVGIAGIKKEIEQKISELTLAIPEDLKKYQTYTAWLINLDGIICYANRYGELASAMAKTESDSIRKNELNKIAEICRRVPEFPARGLWEAIQSCWFIYVGYMLQNCSTGIGFGRMDQYLYPYYEKDIADGTITKNEVSELLAMLSIRINGTTIPFPETVACLFGGHILTCNITIGGIDSLGQSAVNDLSYLFLEAQELTALGSDDIVIRVNKNTPTTFLVRAVEAAIKLRGKFKWVGDETIIQQLLIDDKTIDMARNYSIDGCFQSTVEGRSIDLPAGAFNMALMMELALNNGVSRITGMQVGPKTGDPKDFKKYEDVWNAVKAQVEALLPYSNIYKTLDWRLFIELCPNTFVSPMFDGCIETGLDVLEGGTGSYATHTTFLAGCQNVADSLAALKKTVFDDEKLSMEQVLDAISKDFAGADEVLHILSSAPKFGNDDPYVDTIMNDIVTLGSANIVKYKGLGSVKSTACVASTTMNIVFGAIIGALPDGKRSLAPIADGISPHMGRNVNGLTSTLNSVAKLDYTKFTGGAVLNVKIDPDLIKDESRIRNLVSLIKAYFETGGYLIQFNIVNTEILRAAQKQPELYRDLLVRVATYSAYFTQLSSDLQNDIIERLEIEKF